MVQGMDKAKTEAFAAGCKKVRMPQGTVWLTKGDRLRLLAGEAVA
jgi:hypothetical protein